VLSECSPDDCPRAVCAQGRAVQVELDPADTVARLKEKIFDKEGVPVEQLHLVFRDRGAVVWLQNVRVVAEYGIPNGGAVWQILCRLRGEFP
jgi:Ubiquitin family